MSVFGEIDPKPFSEKLGGRDCSVVCIPRMNEESLKRSEVPKLW